MWLLLTVVAGLSFAALTTPHFSLAQETRQDARQQQEADEDRATRSAHDASTRDGSDTRGAQRALDPPPGEEPDASPPPAEPEPREQANPPEPSRDDRVGITAMRQRLGANAPAGRGIVIAQVEGKPGQYLPLKQGRWTGSTTVVAQGGPSEAFGHAGMVGRTIYGTGGVAPGIDLVHSYPVNAWMEDVLRVGSPKPPAETPARVVNHSWIAQQHPHASRILRRADYLVNRHGVLLVAGVNNGRGKVPELLAPAYNGLAVGKHSGNNSGGYTTVEVSGRCKPDLVAVGGTTSSSTGVVTGAVACLLEYADSLDEPDRAAAGRPEVIKAALLAGAVRGSDWQPEDGKPLDQHFGAGELNLDHSLLCLLAGRAEPGKLQRRAGWALDDAGEGDAHRYILTVQQPMGAFGIALTWHRRIDGRTYVNREKKTARWIDSPRLTDFDLRLIDLDTKEAVAESASAIDNVELIHLPATEPGRYAIEVERVGKGVDPRWQYGLAYLLHPPAE